MELKVIASCDVVLQQYKKRTFCILYNGIVIKSYLEAQENRGRDAGISSL